MRTTYLVGLYPTDSLVCLILTSPFPWPKQCHCPFTSPSPSPHLSPSVLPSVTLSRAPLTLTPRTPAHHAQTRPSPGPLGLVSSPRQPGPHRSTGTSLGKARPPFSGCRQPQGHGRACKASEGLPECRAGEAALPRLGPSFARCSPKEAGEEGLRVLHLALRFSQQRHSLSLLPGGVHDVAQLPGSGPTPPGDDSQAPDTAHSAEFRPLR